MLTRRRHVQRLTVSQTRQQCGWSAVEADKVAPHYDQAEITRDVHIQNHDCRTRPFMVLKIFRHPITFDHWVKSPIVSRSTPQNKTSPSGSRQERCNWLLMKPDRSRCC